MRRARRARSQALLQLTSAALTGLTNNIASAAATSVMDEQIAARAVRIAELTLAELEGKREEGGAT